MKKNHENWDYDLGLRNYDYAGMEITWDNGNTTTTRWGGESRLYLGMCQGKTQRQIDLDIYHGRVKGYNHWQRIGARQPVYGDEEVCTWRCLMYWLCIRLIALSLHHAPRCDQLWAMGDVVDVTTPGCISGKGVPLSVGLRGTIMVNPHLDSADGCCHDFKDRSWCPSSVDSRQVSRSAGDVFCTL